MRLRQLWPFLPTCQLCQCQPALPDQVLCQGCHQDLPWRLDRIQLDQINIHVLLDYQWPIDRLLHLFKYQQRLDLLPIFRHALHYQQRLDVDAIIPMPCSATKLRKRGYNQAQLLAQQLSQLWQIPIWPHLHRVKHSPAQQQLDRAERLSNLQDAFAVVQPARMPAKILLLDDVLTTGASFCTAAACLQQAATVEIQGLVMASQHQTAQIKLV